MKRRIGVAAAVCILAVFAALGFMYYRGYREVQGKLLPNTWVNGMDVSGMTAEEARAQYEATSSAWALTVQEMDGASETIPYRDFDYRLTMGTSFEKLIADQNYYKWPLANMKKTVIKTKQGFTFNEGKLKRRVHALDAVSGSGVKDPVNAYIDKTADGYVIVREKDGNRLIEDKVAKLAAGAVTDGPASIDLVAEDCYRKAEIRSDNKTLQGRFKKLDDVQNTVLTIYLENGAVETLDKSTFLDWMEWDDEDRNVLINTGAVMAYTNDLGDRYDTLGTVRHFTNSHGDVIEVGGNPSDSYGFKMDRETTAARIREALEGAESKKMECAWYDYALDRDTENGDIGYTYIEVSLDDQHMWYYKDGELKIETDVVTGLDTEERRTPTGVYAVLDKLRDHTMTGSYGSAFVHYTLAYNIDGICIHDATWRGSFGGDIWRSSGSHGCVNTPISVMAELYGMVDLNTPIVVY